MAEEEAQPVYTPPWGEAPGSGNWAELTESELKEIRQRASREDYKRIIDALAETGAVTIVPDPEPVAP